MFWNDKELKRIEALERELKEERSKNIDLLETKCKNNELNNKVSNISKSLKESEAKVRTQTEADMFFEIKKIEKKLMDGEKVDTLKKDYNNIILLQTQFAQMQRNSLQ